jgi:hypothetical protein
LRVTTMASKTGELPTGERKKSAPVIGPAPPPGRTQPIRTYQSDDEIDDNDVDDDDDNDDDSLAGGTPFTGLKNETLAGMLMDAVKTSERDTAYYIVDELITRLQKQRSRIEALEAAAIATAKATATATAGSEGLQEAITEAVAKVVIVEVGKVAGDLRKEIQDLKKGGLGQAVPTTRS